METPFLDQLIEEHQNHIESVEASSYAGIPETRKQLAELEAIKAIIVTHCCKSYSELLCDHPRSERSCIGQNMLKCNKCGKDFS